MAQPADASEHRMPRGDLAAWLAAKPASPPPPKAKEEKTAPPAPPSPPLADEILIFLCKRGDAEGIAYALARGASLDAVDSHYPRASAFSTALGAGHVEAALDLLRAGALPVEMDAELPRPASGSADAGDGAAAAGGADAERREFLLEAALTKILGKAASWATLAQARDIARPSMDDPQLLARACSEQRFELAAEGVESGAAPTAAMWSALAEARLRGAPSFDSHPERAGFFKLLRGPAAAHIGSDACQLLFASAALSGDRELLEALIDGGLRPNAQWTVDIPRRWWNPRQAGYGSHEASTPEVPLLLAAAHAGSWRCFHLLMQCPPMMDAMRRLREPPRRFARLDAESAFELLEAGVDLSATDADGSGLAHWWAKADEAPRPGWPALARKAPGILHQLDSEGKTGATRMAERIADAKARGEFEGMIARIESRALRSPGAGRRPAPAKASKARL